MYSQTATPTSMPRAWRVRDLDAVHIQKLRGFIRKRVSDQEDAEDLLQGTLLEALRSEQKFNQQSLPQTWLCGIALNLVRSHFRSLGKLPFQGSLEDFEHQSVGGQVEIDRHVDQHRQLVRAISAIDDLPCSMREIMTINLELDGNYLATAMSLGVPVGTVRSRLSRARDHLKRSVVSTL
ncbi:RNA polymerase subunit sigma [Pseudomonas fluorescens]|uniref:RNA polymerase sigma factor n=1 Tax=Pseudomonas fluorescens TaxID=294 RepID=A0A1T2Y6A8_PSEFL|nr:RNA polymerase sigma factor [Pseudomonas fluorescens]OPA87515.1 RNA polymerase subunit sigma [Pseudomonas fluorescens]